MCGISQRRDFVSQRLVVKETSCKVLAQLYINDSNIIKSVPRMHSPPARRNSSSEYDIYFIIDAIIMCLIATAGIVAAVAYNNALYLIPVGMAEAKLGLIAHEACHGAAPRYLAWIYDCALGSNAQWIFKHNKGHHLETNQLTDPDLDVSPVLRMHPSHPWLPIHKYQHIYQYILFAIVPISLRLQGVCN